MDTGRCDATLSGQHVFTRRGGEIRCACGVYADKVQEAAWHRANREQLEDIERARAVREAGRAG